MNTTIPAWLDGIVMKLLEKNPDDRFESSQQVGVLLEECLSHLQQPTTTPLPSVAAALAIEKPKAASPKNASLFRRLPPVKNIIGILAFAFFALFAGALIVLELDKGTLKIESDSDDIPIVIFQDNEVVQRLTIHRTGKKIRLSAGRYRIEFDESVTGFDIDDSSVVLQRGTTQVAKVTHVGVAPIDRSDNGSPASQPEKNLWEAIREFNHLHPSDAKGNPQQRLGLGEIYTRLLWMIGNHKLPDEVIDLARTKMLVRNRTLPQGWKFTGGLVRHQVSDGIVQTWEIYLETNGLSEPILIRKTALAPPNSRMKPSALPDDVESTISLADAISHFNESCKDLEGLDKLYLGIWLGGQEMTPLTKNEVLAAIALHIEQLSDGEAQGSTRAQLERILRLHQIPKGTRFKALTSFKNKIGGRFKVWSIQLVLPSRNPQNATDPISIRHHYVDSDAYHPDAIHWGKAGENGIQAGFILNPPKKVYEIGDIVSVDFTYRRVSGAPISATLPSVFRYRMVRAQCIRDDVQGKASGGIVKTTIGRDPLFVSGKKIQFCRDLSDKVDATVGTKLVLPPGKRSRLQFVIDNPTSDERLETGKSHQFSIPSNEPKKELPRYVGHWYSHWGRSVPGHQQPAESTPDPSFNDPFRVGVSLRKTDQSRIPAYFAGGLEVTKVAPHSPAKAVGIEVGDIILKWGNYQIYGDDPTKPLKYKSVRRELQERLDELEKYNGFGSSSMKFDLLDHRTDEVLQVVLALGRTASGGPTKEAALKRLMKRQMLRSSHRWLPFNKDANDNNPVAPAEKQ